MTIRLDNLGYARVFRHPRTGDLVVDTDSLRRGGFAGADDIGAEDDDDFEGDDDDFEGDDDTDDAELGAARERPRRARRLDRRQGRLDRKEGRVDRRQDRVQTRQDRTAPRPAPREPLMPRRDVLDAAPSDWGMTAVSGTDTLAGAGAASVKIRLQHDFRAEDVTFTGSAAGAKVTSIFFGDRVVWSSSEGIDATVFGSTSLLRGLLRGQSLRAGLDITVNGSLTGAGDFAVTIVGAKPVTAAC
jgi:hypothetical protein